VISRGCRLVQSSRRCLPTATTSPGAPACSAHGRRSGVCYNAGRRDQGTATARELHVFTLNCMPLELHAAARARHGRQTHLDLLEPLHFLLMPRCTCEKAYSRCKPRWSHAAASLETMSARELRISSKLQTNRSPKPTLHAFSGAWLGQSRGRLLSNRGTLT
jgi:hypothetical protein